MQVADLFTAASEGEFTSTHDATCEQYDAASSDLSACNYFNSFVTQNTARGRRRGANTAQIAASKAELFRANTG